MGMYMFPQTTIKVFKQTGGTGSWTVIPGTPYPAGNTREWSGITAGINGDIYALGKEYNAYWRFFAFRMKAGTSTFVKMHEFTGYNADMGGMGTAANGDIWVGRLNGQDSAYVNHPFRLESSSSSPYSDSSPSSTSSLSSTSSSTVGSSESSYTQSSASSSSSYIYHKFRPLSQPNLRWSSMSQSANGDIYACVYGGDIYKQTASVGNFIAQGAGSQNWTGVCVAYNGDVYGSVELGDIYVKAAGSSSFVALGQTSRNWSSMCATPNGNVYATVMNGNIYRRLGGTGNFQSLSQPTRRWWGMAADASGNIYAGEYEGDVYKQTGGTGNFTPLDQIIRGWTGFTVASNGDVYASVYYDDIFKMAGGIGHFIDTGQGSREWFGMAHNSNGAVYACVSSGDIYRQEGRGTDSYSSESSSSYTQSSASSRSSYTNSSGSSYTHSSSSRSSNSNSSSSSSEIRSSASSTSNSSESSSSSYTHSSSSGDWGDSFKPLNQPYRSWTTMTTSPEGDVFAATQYTESLIYRQKLGEGNFIHYTDWSLPDFSDRLVLCVTPSKDFYVAPQGRDIYKQIGGTGPFYALGQTARQWTGMTGAPNGDVYACVQNGDIYMQTGGTGDFVALGQTTRQWYGLTADADGNIYACVYQGVIYKQTGGTGAFNVFMANTEYWQGICYSPYGNIYDPEMGCLYAITNVGASANIYLVDASGYSPVYPYDKPRAWYGITATPRGDVYACVLNGDVYEKIGPHHFESYSSASSNSSSSVVLYSSSSTSLSSFVSIVLTVTTDCAVGAAGEYIEKPTSIGHSGRNDYMGPNGFWMLYDSRYQYWSLCTAYDIQSGIVSTPSSAYSPPLGDWGAYGCSFVVEDLYSSDSSSSYTRSSASSSSLSGMVPGYIVVSDVYGGSGTYCEAGVYNGLPYYENAVTGYALYYDNQYGDYWVFSSAVGNFSNFFAYYYGYSPTPPLGDWTYYYGSCNVTAGGLCEDYSSSSSPSSSLSAGGMINYAVTSDCPPVVGNYMQQQTDKSNTGRSDYYMAASGYWMFWDTQGYWYITDGYDSMTWYAYMMDISSTPPLGDWTTNTCSANVTQI
jgi:hypothetical protein